MFVVVKYISNKSNFRDLLIELDLNCLINYKKEEMKTIEKISIYIKHD